MNAEPELRSTFDRNSGAAQQAPEHIDPRGDVHSPGFEAAGAAAAGESWSEVWEYLSKH